MAAARRLSLAEKRDRANKRHFTNKRGEFRQMSGLLWAQGLTEEAKAAAVLADMYDRALAELEEAH